MDQGNRIEAQGASFTLGRKSWTAYTRLILLSVFLFLVVTPLVCVESILAGMLLLLVFGAFVAYRFLAIRSVRLYCDDDGVWVFSGVLPWNKGVQGVKWRDLDEAVFFQGMGSWLFKSYTMRIGHRFTKSNEITLSHIKHGHDAVIEINTRHQNMVRNNLLT